MKIIYLDQFVLQNAFCPSPKDPHRDFFVQLGKLCMKLAEKRVAAFPFSESHLRETALHPDKAKSEVIAESFAAISNGYQFCPAQGVLELQARAVRKGLPIDWSAHRVVFEDTQIGFREKLSATIIPDRALHHAKFKQVLLQFQNAADAKLDGIAKREAQAYGELLTKDLATRMVTGTTPDLLSLIDSPYFRLFMELEREMRADGVIDSLMEAYRFVRDRVMEVPCIRMESELWEHFVKARRKALAHENDPASTVEDIKFVACFVPYCDAAFVERKMTAWLVQSKLLAGQKTALFSLAYRKDEFIQYLSGLEKDHVNPISLKTFAAFETDRLATLRLHNRPLLWICFIPTHPDDLVLSKTVNPQNAPDSLIECRILPGGGIEWFEAIHDITSISSDLLESLIRRALDRIMAVPREGCHVSMRVNYSLANCAGMEIKSHSGSQSKKVESDLFRLGVSDWLTDSHDLLWPKPDEILTALFQSKSPKPRAKGRMISAALSGLAAAMFGAVIFCGGCVSHVAKNPSPGPVTGRIWNLSLSTNATLEMAWIPPGTFILGSPASEPLRKADEGPQARVTLAKGFWLGKTMVTIGQWKTVMGRDVRGQLGRMLQDDTLYDFDGRQQTVRDFMRFSRDADPGQYLANEYENLPMYFVSWNDAMEFCRKLNGRERVAGRLPAGYEYNLPTEAQWEYACRAGTTNATYAGALVLQGRRAPVLDRIAWYDADSPDGYTGKGFNVSGRTGGPRPVAQKQPNAWGLYDMTGNVWQWCRDWYGPYPGGSLTDPTGPATGTHRVNRGGSFGSSARDERSANRAKNPPAEASTYRGFRLALCPAP